MLKLLIIFVALLALICAIECTPTPVKRDRPDRPSNRPRDRPDRPSARPKRDRPERPSAHPKRDRPERPSAHPRRDRPERPSAHPRRENVEARGLCDFVCPNENPQGGGLNSLYADPTRLYCMYDVQGSGENPFCMFNRNSGELLSGSSFSECNQVAAFHCPGTKNVLEDVQWAPSPPRDSRSVNLPQFVKARALARRAAEENAV